MKGSSDRIDHVISGAQVRARQLLSWSDTTTSRWPELSVVAFVGVALLYVVRKMWFFGDDWAYLIYRFHRSTTGRWFEAIFAPHNEHLSALPAAVFLAFERIFGVGSALPYLAVMVLGHLLVLWAVRTLLVRMDVPMVGRLIAIVWLGFFGAGAENLVWGFQAGFIWGIALALWGLIVMTGGDEPSFRRDLGASALFLLALFTVGTSVPIVIVSIGVLVLQRSWIRVLRVFLVPLVFYGAWYVFYGKSRIPSHPTSLTTVVPYLTKGIATGLDQTVQFAGIGLVAGFVALILVAQLADFKLGERRLVAILAASIAVFFVMGGINRGYLGADQAAAVRYIYFVGALAVPVLVLVAARVVVRWPRLLAVVAFLVAIAVIGNGGALVSFRNDRLIRTDEAKWKLTSAIEYLDSPYVADDAQLEPVYNPDVNLRGLRELRDLGLWSSDVELTALMRLDAAVRFGIRVGIESPPPELRSQIGAIASVEGAAVASAGECLVFQPTSLKPKVVLAPHQSAAFSIDTDGAPSSIYMRSESDPSVHSGSVDLRTTGVLDPVWVVSFPNTGQPVLDLPASTPTTLCGLQAQ